MDFEQKKITRIHNFCMDFDRMASRLNSLSAEHPAGLIIPIKGSDIESSALRHIITEVNRCDYLKKVFIALYATDPKNYEDALAIAQKLEVPCEIIWCNKPEVEIALKELRKKGLDVTKLTGKGKDVWIAIGIASLELHAFALHDGDIVSYSKAVPTRLLYPVVEPKLDSFFTKGYYARVNLGNKRMYGRLYRLFINPLLEALQEKLLWRSEFLRYLQSFSYPLAGEVAIQSDLALNLRIPCDWGFEIGMLSELFRNVSYKRIFEVDLGFYEHKHKDLTTDGLLRTAEDSLVTLLRTLTETDAINISEPFLLSLQVLYRRLAQDRIRQYSADALCNNLNFDRHEEETDVDSLSNAITRAGKNYLRNPIRSQLPDWIRTLSAMPDIREKLREVAIEQ